MKFHYKLSLILLGVISCAQLELSGWSSVVNLSSASINAENPSLASDPNGNAMVVWDGYDPSGYQKIMASYYTAGTGWDVTPTVISLSGPPGGHAFQPFVSMDSSGNAMAVWHRVDGSNYIIQASYYTFLTSTWSAPVNISTIGQNSFNPQFLFNGSGNGIAVWYNAHTKTLRASSYTKLLNSWSASTNISSAGQASFDYQLAVSSSGNAQVVWSSKADTNNKHLIEATYYNLLLWATPVTISNILLNSRNPNVVLDHLGNGISIWDDDTDFYIQGSTFTLLSIIWSAVTTIFSSSSLAYQNALTNNPTSGHAISVWSNFSYTGPQQIIQAATYNGSTWSSAQTISATSTICEFPAVAIDTLGNGVSVWNNYSYLDTIVQASSYTSGSNTWSSPTTISNATGIASNPLISINPAAASPVAFVAWQYTPDEVNYYIQAVTNP